MAVVDVCRYLGCQSVEGFLQDHNFSAQLHPKVKSAYSYFTAWHLKTATHFIRSNSPSPTNPDHDRYELHSIQIKDVTAVKIQQPRRGREKNFQQYFQSKQ